MAWFLILAHNGVGSEAWQNEIIAEAAEIRKEWEDAQKKMKEQAAEAREEPEQGEVQYEIDFSVEKTGQRKAVNGFDTEQVVMTITVRPLPWLRPEEPAGIHPATAELLATLAELHDIGGLLDIYGIDAGDDAPLDLAIREWADAGYPDAPVDPA
jgi:hypothetical protein